MSKPTLWTRDFIIVSLLNFLVVLVFYLLVVVIGVYASRNLQASVSQSGLVVGAFIVGALLGRILIGQFIDKLGRKRCMLYGLLLAALASLAYFFNFGLSYFVAIRIVHGIAVGIAATAIATVVAHLVPASRRGEGIGYFGVSTSLATAMGPFIGIWMMQAAGFTAILSFCSVIAVMCLVVGMLLHVPELPEKQRQSLQPRFTLTGLLEKRVVPICFVMLLTGVYFSSVLSYLSAFAVERDISEAARFFFMVYACSVLISRPVAGRLLDSRGGNIVMYPSFLLLGAGFGCIASAYSGFLLLVGGVLIGLGFGTIQTCIQTLVIKLVETERIALATSTFFIFVDAGLGFGPYLLGLLISFVGYGNLYLGLAIVSVLTLFVYRQLHGRTEQRIA